MKSKIIVKFGDNYFSNMAEQEAELAKVPGAVRPKGDSPVRFEIIREKLRRGDDTKSFNVISILMKTMVGVNRSIKSIKNNPVPER